MAHIDTSLSNIINIEKWQILQDSLANVTQLALITTDYTGAPVTKHSKCSAFCQQVRNDPAMSEMCYKCDARGGLEAVREHKPYIYYCHFKIIDIAIPIIVNNKYIGAIMAGQVRLSDETNLPYELEQIIHPKNTKKFQNTLNAYHYEYSILPTLPMSQIQNISNMLFHLCNYIVGEAIESDKKLQMYMAMFTRTPDFEPVNSKTGFEISNIKNVKKDVSNSLLDVLISEQNTGTSRITPPILQPAFEYIHNHKGESIKSNDVAAICHISPSYFSRLFSKTVGVTFNTYISQLKLSWARELLETTTFSITEISETLGFSESGYFIKKFKGTYGITPHNYRKSFHQKNKYV